MTKKSSEAKGRRILGANSKHMTEVLKRASELKVPVMPRPEANTVVYRASGDDAFNAGENHE